MDINFLRMLVTLPNFLFTTSESKRDYKKYEWYVRVAEPLKTFKIKKDQGNLKNFIEL